MPIEKQNGFDEEPSLENEGIVRPAEKLKGFRKKLWEKTRAIFSRVGMEYPNGVSLEIEEDTVAKISEIRNKNDDDRFLDLEVSRDGEDLNLRTVAQIDGKHNPDREKNYDEWDLTPQEEAERWLNREILVGEKLAKFTRGEGISADELVDANRDPKDGALFLLKRTKEQERQLDEYGELEGRALAKSLLDMQKNLQATEMVKEIMAEENLENKLEMEQKIFEDYFDHFDGYIDNSKVILEELGDEEMAKRLEQKMEEFRAVIEESQLAEDEYSFVHGNINFDTVRYSKDGRAYLSDWQRAGKTQNKALALVYDLGTALQEAVEKLDTPRTEKFISGIETEVRAYYNDKPEAADAVINLAKLRSFAMIVNDLEGDKKVFVLKELGE